MVQSRVDVDKALATTGTTGGSVFPAQPASCGRSSVVAAALLQTLRRSKHQELSRAELESRRLPRGTKLGIGYFVYDAIGANLVTCVKTTSGDVLRLRE
ncbi:hypothetical protein HPB52_011795 [Rhipicephalus sanguineus]|uniref:Uncharacterized protein n=1 Tax=Rhipicephalus sanguineus TaxID=34632 RepID=A0A9D4PIE3_RHISA|nr:hypothetical protein HPB52_011795 [Rhipicephalus sanguineus]